MGGGDTDTVYVADLGNNRISVFVNTEPAPTDTTPPPTPTLQSPTNGYTIADNTPTLDWSDVTDPSTPVTYDLFVDDNSDFSSPITSQTGLTSSEFTMGPLHLADGLYYWTVKAKDGAGNPGISTTTLQFTIDTSPAPAVCLDRNLRSRHLTPLSQNGAQLVPISASSNLLKI